VELGQIFSEYFSFPACHSTYYSTLIIIRYPGLVQEASNDLSNSGLGSTPSPKGKKKRIQKERVRVAYILRSPAFQPGLHLFVFLQFKIRERMEDCETNDGIYPTFFYVYFAYRLYQPHKSSDNMCKQRTFKYTLIKLLIYCVRGRVWTGINWLTTGPNADDGRSLRILKGRKISLEYEYPSNSH
jgi:hypothetical protein